MKFIKEIGYNTDYIARSNNKLQQNLYCAKAWVGERPLMNRPKKTTQHANRTIPILMIQKQQEKGLCIVRGCHNFIQMGIHEIELKRKRAHFEWLQSEAYLRFFTCKTLNLLLQEQLTIQTPGNSIINKHNADATNPLHSNGHPST